MADPFALHAALWSALHHRDWEALRAAVAAFAATDRPQLWRPSLHLAHLFYGFPRVLQALNQLPPSDSATAPPAATRAAGEAVFREVYGDDAERVLSHLQQLDPPFTTLVLEHAYGRLFGHSPLTLVLRERLSVLALLATGCPDQAYSHFRACLRHGVPSACLRQDLEQAGWLDAAAKATAQPWFEDPAESSS